MVVVASISSIVVVIELNRGVVSMGSTAFLRSFSTESDGQTIAVEWKLRDRLSVAHLFVKFGSRMVITSQTPG